LSREGGKGEDFTVPFKLYPIFYILMERKLTERQKLAFKLVVVRRLTHKEAAKMMGISRPAVTKLIGRLSGNYQTKSR